MKKTLTIAVLLLAGTSTTVFGQDQNLQSTSGSNSTSTSGSASNAENQIDNSANNAIGTSQSNSDSNATANSGSVSGSESYGNSSTQGQAQEQANMQGQEQSNNQGQGQDQGQDQGQMQSQGLDSEQANAQETSITFNNSQRKVTEVRTNNAVPLAASSSFSTDYCGGTVSGGASVAPLGISLGGAAPKFDKTCQALRRAEKFGMAAANASNMGNVELASRLMSMMIWSICTADGDGAGMDEPTAMACDEVGLLGSQSLASQASPLPPAPATAPEPQLARNDQVTPEAAERAQSMELEFKLEPEFVTEPVIQPTDDIQGERKTAIAQSGQPIM